MTADDVAWAAALMERRRQGYAGYSPVFWRPRPGVTGLHARLLSRQVASPGYVALRTGHGFLIGQSRGQEGFVDDFAVDQTARWDADGAALLLAAWHRWEADGVQAARVVTAHADEDKRAMLAALHLDLAEQWWVRELRPAFPPASLGLPASPGPPARAGPVTGTGFAGLLGPAPPVYDPGGPVLLVSDLADDADLGGADLGGADLGGADLGGADLGGADLGGADLGAVERQAAAMGAVLLIVPAAPGSDRSELLARRPGWTVASDWYLGCPRQERGRPGVQKAAAGRHT
jgi:hypothetical protein